MSAIVLLTELIDLAAAATTTLTSIQSAAASVAKAQAEGRDLSDAELDAIRKQALDAHAALGAKLATLGAS